MLLTLVCVICATSASGELVIPATIEGYPVTSIGYQAFYYCYSLKTVTILGEMDTIGNYAFADCYSLNHVFFAGDEAGWDWIIIEDGNGYLQNATRHYNCTGEEIVNGVCTICHPLLTGDADGDGFIDAFDASLIMKYSVGAISADELNVSVLDVDGDGVVDAFDASLIQKYSVGAIDKFPIDE